MRPTLAIFRRKTIRYLICEVFEDFVKATTRDQKIAVLRSNGKNDLKSVLRATFHPKIRFLVDHWPKYKPMPGGKLNRGVPGNSLGSEMKRIYLFEDRNPRTPKNYTQAQRETLLIQILESVEAEEAIIFMNMLLKNLKVPGLDAAIVTEAFPGLLDD